MVPIHLCGDRAIFGNFLKPFSVPFEPEKVPEFAAFQQMLASTTATHGHRAVASKSAVPDTAGEGGLIMTAGTTPAEADWDTAPSLMDGAMSLELTAADCNLAYWFQAVPNGTLRGHIAGHAPEVAVPTYLRQPGPLRQALAEEFAFRSVAETKATAAIGYLVAQAPDLDSMEFFATQLIDEARHAMVFRNHLVELGVARPERPGPGHRSDDRHRTRAAILDPLEEFGLRVLRDEHDYLGGVVTLTILVEGVLAPSAELSERKWRCLDPAAADIERGAGIDEIRHLAVGSSIARDHLIRHPEQKPAVLDLIQRGVALWSRLPVKEQLIRRESLFQEGHASPAGRIGDYEIWPGRRLADTTVEERLQTALDWSAKMQDTRLAYMGLEEAMS